MPACLPSFLPCPGIREHFAEGHPTGRGWREGRRDGQGRAGLAGAPPMRTGRLQGQRRGAAVATGSDGTGQNRTDRTGSGRSERDRAEPDGIGLDRTGQNRVETNRTGQNRAGQGRTGRDRAEPGRSDPDRTGIGQNRAEADGIGQDRTGPGRTVQERAEANRTGPRTWRAGGSGSGGGGGDAPRPARLVPGTARPLQAWGSLAPGSAAHARPSRALGRRGTRTRRLGMPRLGTGMKEPAGPARAPGRAGGRTDPAAPAAGRARGSSRSRRRWPRARPIARSLGLAERDGAGRARGGCRLAGCRRASESEGAAVSGRAGGRERGRG